MRVRLNLTAFVLAAALAGCSFPQPAPRSVISTGPNGLRTFSWVTEVDGSPLVCPAFGLVHPVSGILRGDPDDRQEPIWLEGNAGTRLSVVWPAAFTVSFEPDVVLRDESGVVVASANDRVELGQVDAFAHAGTFGDPYIASGILFNGCYPFLT